MTDFLLLKFLMMRYPFFILSLSFYFLNCESKKDNFQIGTQRANKIENIVKAVMIQDSLNVFIDNNESNYFCEDLSKLNIKLTEKVNKRKGVLPLPHSVVVQVEYLISKKVNNDLFFTVKDTASIYIQNKYPEMFKLNIENFKDVNFISLETAKKKRRNNEYFNFYSVSIPIFSSDNRKAYLQVMHICGSLCGSGQDVFLEKIRGKWTIVDKFESWVN